MKKTLFVGLLMLAAGIALGAYLFSDTKPRSLLTAPECGEECLSEEQLLGLLGSVGVQKFPDLIPFVVKETDKAVAMKHPVPKSDIHYVVIPKKDIKAVGDIAQEDAEYLAEAYALLRELITDHNLTNYKVVTNGPGFQTVQYLHFHLVSEHPD